MRSTLLLRLATPLLFPALLLLGLLARRTTQADEDPEPAPAPSTPRIMPLDEIRPGMRGHVMTVVAGTKSVRFEVEVIDLIHDYLPKQDVILVRCFGEEIEQRGVAEGMSGSPVYIDGRIAGALAYTWGWLKEPYGGVTPIEAMLAEADRKPEGRPSGAEPATPLVSPHRSPHDLSPIGTPVCVGGFSAEGRRRLAGELASLGLDLRGAGGGLVAGAPAEWADLDAEMVPGAALSVDLVRGDLSVAVIGTCTWVDGERIHAFGHNFQNVGETLYPLSVAYIYSVIPTQSISFKLGASIREVGALVQDRQSGIVGIKGRKAPMVPFAVNVKNEVTGREESFHFEVTANRLLFQRMMLLALGEAVGKAEGTLGANTKRYRLEVKLAGLDEPWVYEDAFVSFDSGVSRVLIGLVDRVLIHPNERADFERVRLDVAIENTDRRVFIESVTASRDEAQPGDEVELLVRMRKKEGGAVFYERIDVRVPRGAPEGNFAVRVVGGDMVEADVAAPVDIADIPALYDAFRKSTELVALVPTGRIDLDMGGHLFPNIPLSALPRLVRSEDNAGIRLHPVTEKIGKDVPYVVAGSGQAVIRVVR